MTAVPSPSDESAFVDIVRDFLSAHAALRRVASLHRAGRLQFDEVKALVGDGEEAVLFRLKERCHELFRGEGAGADVGREALLDLAVGALFHECMKLRESFYQHAVYGPKVRALRAAARPDREALFREFEKILAQSSVRLAEALQEAEILLHQTSVELDALVRARSESGLLARLLVERGDELAAALGRPLEAFVAEVFGSWDAALERAARSYLASGYFGEAARAFEGVRDGGAEVPALRHYALGMQAFLERDYATAVQELRQWSETCGGRDPRLAEQAWVALSRVGPLLDDARRASALELADRLRPSAARARQRGGALG
jgi:hypothetical protein